MDVTREKAAYALVEGEPIEVGHHGKTVTLTKEQPVALAVPPAPVRPAPSQPSGREPTRRGIEASVATDT